MIMLSAQEQDLLFNFTLHLQSAHRLDNGEWFFMFEYNFIVTHRAELIKILNKLLANKIQHLYGGEIDSTHFAVVDIDANNNEAKVTLPHIKVDNLQVASDDYVQGFFAMLVHLEAAGVYEQQTTPEQYQYTQIENSPSSAAAFPRLNASIAEVIAYYNLHSQLNIISATQFSITNIGAENLHSFVQKHSWLSYQNSNNTIQDCIPLKNYEVSHGLSAAAWAQHQASQLQLPIVVDMPGSLKHGAPYPLVMQQHDKARANAIYQNTNAFNLAMKEYRAEFLLLVDDVDVTKMVVLNHYNEMSLLEYLIWYWRHANNSYLHIAEILLKRLVKQQGLPEAQSKAILASPSINSMAGFFNEIHELHTGLTKAIKQDALGIIEHDCNNLFQVAGIKTFLLIAEVIHESSYEPYKKFMHEICEKLLTNAPKILKYLLENLPPQQLYTFFIKLDYSLAAKQVDYQVKTMPNLLSAFATQGHDSQCMDILLKLNKIFPTWETKVRVYWNVLLFALYGNQTEMATIMWEHLLHKDVTEGEFSPFLARDEFNTDADKNIIRDILFLSVSCHANDIFKEFFGIIVNNKKLAQEEQVLGGKLLNLAEKVNNTDISNHLREQYAPLSPASPATILFAPPTKDKGKREATEPYQKPEAAQMWDYWDSP